MFTVRQNTTFVGVSELRTHWDKIREAMKTGRVVVGRRHRPDAVLLPVGQFEEMEEALDRLEDYVLAFKAREREAKSRPQDYLTLEEVRQRLHKVRSR